MSTIIYDQDDVKNDKEEIARHLENAAKEIRVKNECSVCLGGSVVVYIDLNEKNIEIQV
ncbi:hypothetical protein KY334_03380 [Candidatus Woesearchaeota archaeon]|nr:hypothetical protein [Candidatus Woesearchaeota archaeon]